MSFLGAIHVQIDGRDRDVALEFVDYLRSGRLVMFSEPVEGVVDTRSWTATASIMSADGVKHTVEVCWLRKRLSGRIMATAELPYFRVMTGRCAAIRDAMEAGAA